MATKLAKRGLHGRAFPIAVADPDIPALAGVWPVADKDEELRHLWLRVPDALVAERAVPLRVFEDDKVPGADHRLEPDSLRGESSLDLLQRVPGPRDRALGRGMSTRRPTTGYEQRRNK